MLDPTATATASDLLAVSTLDGPGGVPVHLVEFTQTKVLDEANITAIGQKLTQLVGEGERPRILIDFSGVEHLSSAALGMLINVNSRLKERNGQMRLCRIDKPILTVFTITKLDTLFKILPDRPAALDSFGPQRA